MEDIIDESGIVIGKASRITEPMDLAECWKIVDRLKSEVGNIEKMKVENKELREALEDCLRDLINPVSSYSLIRAEKKARTVLEKQNYEVGI